MILSSTDFKFHIDLQSNLTLLTGNSGTGKTLLLSKILMYSRRYRMTDKDITVIHITPAMNKAIILSSLTTMWDLCLIDEYDVIINYVPELAEEINLRKKSRFIISGRLFQGLHYQASNIAEVIDNDGILNLRYLI